MIKTPELIEALVADGQPVRRLRAPVTRTALWLVMPVMIFGLLALAHGVRPDLAQRLNQPAFVIGVAASLATGVLAAAAAFMLNQPGRSTWWAVLPVPSLVVWIATIGRSCLTNWIAIGPDGMQAGETARCFATVLLTSLPLSLAIFSMLRHGAVLLPGAATLAGSLAVAAMSATAMMIFHSLDASAMVLLWNLGTAALIVALGSVFGRRFLAIQ